MLSQRWKEELLLSVPYPNSYLRSIWLSVDKSDPSDLSDSCMHACTSAYFEGDYILKQGAVTRPALGIQTATLETAPPGLQDFALCPNSLQADRETPRGRILSHSCGKPTTYWAVQLSRCREHTAGGRRGILGRIYF
ncbi:uncharacterized protein ACIB01_015194 [Guaruba guarouba]